eukprot:6178389-Pleurochrysis_carterae.AAC.1
MSLDRSSLGLLRSSSFATLTNLRGVRARPLAIETVARCRQCLHVANSGFTKKRGAASDSHLLLACNFSMTHTHTLRCVTSKPDYVVDDVSASTHAE